MDDIITTPPEVPANPNPAPPSDPPAQDAPPAPPAPAPAADPATQPPADWRAALPESWRDMLKDAADEESARKVLERGLNYNPASKPEDVVLKYPEGIQVDEGLNKNFQQFCVDKGITPSQAQELLNWQIAANKSAIEAVRASGEKELREKWGPRYEENTAQGLKAVVALDKQMGGRFAEALAYSGMNNNPTMVEALHIIGNSISEDTLSAGAGASAPDKPESAVDTYTAMNFKN